MLQSSGPLEVLKVTGCRISMNGKGRWIDNVFIERLWRSVKYEEVDFGIGPVQPARAA